MKHDQARSIRPTMPSTSQEISLAQRGTELPKLWHSLELNRQRQLAQHLAQLVLHFRQARLPRKEEEGRDEHS